MKSKLFKEMVMGAVEKALTVHSGVQLTYDIAESGVRSLETTRVDPVKVQLRVTTNGRHVRYFLVTISEQC